MFVAVVAAGLLVASATVASAFPSTTSRCVAPCHAAGAGATVAASLVSTSSTTATYNLTMTGTTGSAWAVFDGSTRLAGSTTAAGTFTVGLGKTYDVFAVDKTSSNFVTTSVSPAAASVVPTTTPEPTSTVSLDETMPPVTTSDAIASYVGTATVKLTATDGSGRGVAYVYYSIDGKRVHLVTGSHATVTIAAPLTGTATHKIVFWAQDQAGNVESPKTVTLTVQAPSTPVVRHRATLTTPIAPWSVRKAATFTVWGYLMPQHDAGTEAVTLQFYRLQAGQWVLRRTVKVAVTNHSDESKYSARVSLPYAGVWRIRAVHPGDALHTTSFSGYRSLISHY